MNLEPFFSRLLTESLAWLDTFGANGRYYAWLTLGLLALLFWVWLAHRVMRKLLGHRQFRGTWYNEEQFQHLLKLLDEDCAKGLRVMRHDELKLLRQWSLGTTRGISDGAKGYF